MESRQRHRHRYATKTDLARIAQLDLSASPSPPAEFDEVKQPWHGLPVTYYAPKGRGIG
jgi:hypothetical protein